MANRHPIHRTLCAISTLSLLCVPVRLLADSYTQTNLVSNVPGMAITTDPNLINPWGVAYSATSPFWVANQGSGVATLYDGAGNKNATVVSIPGSATPPSGPTGQVFNSSGAGFSVSGSSAKFIFDTLNGTIAGWSGGTSAVTMATTPGAVYTGLAMDTSGASTYIYAANSNGGIEVFNSSWTDVTATTFAGKFVDPNIPAGYTPFNIQNIGGNLYVTYAQLGPGGVAVPGSSGYVVEFDANGNFIAAIASGGSLDAPWGLTLAPADFGIYSNDLLVGNFGDGEILVFNPTSDEYLGTLDMSNGDPIVDPFLWSLSVRTGGANVNTDAVYFTSGPDDQQDGLFGEIALADTPEPGTLFEFGSGLLGLILLRVYAGRRSQLKG